MFQTSKQAEMSLIFLGNLFLANINVEMLSNMPFFIFSNVNLRFAKKVYIEGLYCYKDVTYNKTSQNHWS